MPLSTHEKHDLARYRIGKPTAWRRQLPSIEPDSILTASTLAEPPTTSRSDLADQSLGAVRLIPVLERDRPS